MEVRTDVRVPAGTRVPAQDAPLPAIAATDRAPARFGILDRTGRALREWWIAAPGAAVVGAAGGGLALHRLVGTKAPGSGVVAAALRGSASVAGAVAGAAAGVGLLVAAHTLMRGRPELDVPPPSPPGRRRGPIEPGRQPHQPVADAGSRERIKVMSFNVRSGIGPMPGQDPGEHQFDRLAETIRRHDPDVVLLQELDEFRVRSRHRDALGELAERLDPDGAVAAAPRDYVTGARQDVAVLTFNGFDIASARNLVHEDTVGDGTIRRTLGRTGYLLGYWGKDAPTGPNWSDYSPRNTLDTVVRTPRGAEVRVVDTHLGGTRSQQPHLRPLADSLAADTGPVIFGGDINVHMRWGSYPTEQRMLARAGLRNSFEAVGKDARDPSVNASPDRLYASDDLRVRSARPEPEETPASDHHPLVVEYELQHRR